MKRRNDDILWKSILEEELAKIYPEPEKKSDTKFVDKLVKVYQQDGTEEWVLVHIEVQGRHDPLFAKRMFKYYCRIFDRYERSYQGSVLTYQYNTLCIMDYDDKGLTESNNPFAMVVLAAKKALLRGKDLDEELLKQKLLIAKLLYRKGFRKRIRKNFRKKEYHGYHRSSRRDQSW